MKNIVNILFIAFALFSCESHVEGEPSCDQEVSFAQNVNPIIVTNCVECHKGNRFPDLRTYSGISVNASNIRSQVVSGLMPQGSSLTNEEIGLISCWIDNGALDN